jgi:hypothetical protein
MQQQSVYSVRISYPKVLCVFLVALWGRIELKLQEGNFVFGSFIFFVYLFYSVRFASLLVGDDAKGIMNQEESIFDDDDDDDARHKSSADDVQVSSSLSQTLNHSKRA